MENTLRTRAEGKVLYFISSGMGTGSAIALKPSGSGDITESQRPRNRVAESLQVDGALASMALRPDVAQRAIRQLLLSHPANRVVELGMQVEL